MIEPGLLMRQAEEDMMIDVAIAAVAAIERADDIIFVLDIDVVGTDKSEHFAKPIHRLAKARRHQNAMTDALDVRWSPGQPHQFTGPRERRFAGIELLPLHRNFRHRCDAANHLDLIAVGLAPPNPLTA